MHNWFGDRLLHKSLWQPTRDSLARGWLVSFPITVIPFLPAQSLFACIGALCVRGNLLLCIAVQFLSTPLTAPVHLPACYFVGEVVRGANPREVWKEVRTTPSHLLTGRAVQSLYLGAAVIGILGGAIGYAILQGTWKDKPRRRALLGHGHGHSQVPAVKRDHPTPPDHPPGPRKRPKAVRGVV